MARGQSTTQMQDVAAGVVGSDGVAIKIRGAIVEKTATGRYKLTINPANPSLLPGGGQGNLSGGLPRAEAAIEVQPVGAGAGPLTAQVTHTSDTEKAIALTDDADVDVDAQFSFRARRLLG